MLALVTSTLSFKAGVTVKAPVAARAQPVMVAAAGLKQVWLPPPPSSAETEQSCLRLPHSLAVGSLAALRSAHSSQAACERRSPTAASSST